MAYNKNYGFEYPGGGDLYNVEDFNKNFDKVSDALDDIINMLGDKAQASHKHNVNDITGVLPVTKGGTGASNTKQAGINLGMQKYCYTVASSDSDGNLKDYADFIINGEQDLRNVINSVPSGSVLRFLAGNYYLYSGAIAINKPLMLIGSGHSTVIYANALNNNPVFKLGTDDVNNPISNITIRDMYMWYRNSGYEGERNLVEAGNINGLYLYRLGLNYNITDEVMAGSSIVKCSGYMRNLHIHDCVINSNISSNSNERYLFDFSGIAADKKSEFCAYISNTSYLNNTEFSINMLDEDMKNKIALTGILGGYKLYVNKQEVAQ